MATNEDESEAYGLLVLGNTPKNSNLDSDCDDWENWINDEYDVSMNVNQNLLNTVGKYSICYIIHL